MSDIMRTIRSPNTFKTCYIAQVKEELGLPVRKAANRKGKARAVQVRQELVPYIKNAILVLQKQKGKIPAYREIQEKALDLYQASNGPSKSDAFYGIFESNSLDYVEEVAEDKEIYYGI